MRSYQGLTVGATIMQEEPKDACVVSFPSTSLLGKYLASPLLYSWFTWTVFPKAKFKAAKYNTDWKLYTVDKL